MKESIKNLNLDSDELLHLAIHASTSGDFDKAIDYLKSIPETAAEYAKAEYFLGAIYAELKMFEQAKAKISSAIDKGLVMPVANFQLGLLYATSGQGDLARSAWEPLMILPKTHPLYLFHQGILALMDDHFAECIQFLEDGIARNDKVQELNDDMRNIIKKLNSLKADGDLPAGNVAYDSVSAGAAMGEKILLSAYSRQKFDD